MVNRKRKRHYFYFFPSKKNIFSSFQTIALKIRSFFFSFLPSKLKNNYSLTNENIFSTENSFVYKIKFKGISTS